MASPVLGSNIEPIKNYQRIPFILAIVIVLIELAAVALVLYVICYALTYNHAAGWKKLGEVIGASILLVLALAALFMFMYKIKNRYPK